MGKHAYCPKWTLIIYIQINNILLDEQLFRFNFYLEEWSSKEGGPPEFEPLKEGGPMEVEPLKDGGPREVEPLKDWSSRLTSERLKARMEALTLCLLPIRTLRDRKLYRAAWKICSIII